MMLQTSHNTIHNFATGQTYWLQTLDPNGYSKSTEVRYRVLTGRDELKVLLCGHDGALELWQDMISMCAKRK